MLNILSPFALAIAAFVIGAQGFTVRGLPLTKEKRLTGRVARIIGGICLLMGVAFSALGIWFLIKVTR